jgi:hypothetical protein
MTVQIHLMSDILRADDTADAIKKAVEKGTEVQRDLIRQFSAIQQDTLQNFLSMTYYYAMFKTTVQTGGRISIPEAERQALKIEEGDLVQVIVIPIERKRKNTQEE